MDTSFNSEAIIAEWLSRRVLDRAEPELAVAKQGRRENVPGKESKNVRWVRYGSVNPNTTPLVEKTTPAETAIDTSDVSVTAAQYGQYACVSDELEDISAFDNLRQAADILGDAASKTIETLVIDELVTESAEQFQGGAVDADALTASDTLTIEDCLSASNQQAQDNLKPHRDGLYTVVLHRAALYDLLIEADNVAFSTIMQHTDRGQRKIEKGSLGELYGLRFMVSDLMEANDNMSAVSIKDNFVFAYEPFGVVDIKNRGIRVMRTRREPSDSDPLGQRQKVGYKFWYATKYLDPGSKRSIRLQAASGS